MAGDALENPVGRFVGDWPIFRLSGYLSFE